MAVSVTTGNQTGLQHLIRLEADAQDNGCRRESGLLNLGETAPLVFVLLQRPDLV